MKPQFNVEIESFKTIYELPESWNASDFKAILELCDFDSGEEIPENELFDYVSMALQEMDPEEAAETVIKYRLGEKLKTGQIKNMAHDMQEDNLWEEYQDMSLHEEIFNINSLLYKIFKGKFPLPDAAEIKMKISATNQDGEVTLKKFDESLISRIIANGQDDFSILNRLFDEKIAGNKFEEAKDIIWQYKITEQTANYVVIDLTTALYWVKGLKGLKEFEAETHNDY